MAREAIPATAPACPCMSPARRRNPTLPLTWAAPAAPSGRRPNPSPLWAKRNSSPLCLRMPSFCPQAKTKRLSRGSAGCFRLTRSLFDGYGHYRSRTGVLQNPHLLLGECGLLLRSVARCEKHSLQSVGSFLGRELKASFTAENFMLP